MADEIMTESLGTTPFWQSKRRIEAAQKVLAMVVIVLLSTIMIIPLAWMLAMSLKAPQNVFEMPPWRVDWLWSNYMDAWYPYGKPNLEGLSFFGKVNEFFAGQESFWMYLWNTLVITVSSTFGAVFSAAVVAFGFARLRFPARGPLFVVALATMMIPPQVIMIPTFVLFSKMSLTDTFYPLILPAFLGGGAYNIFLLRQFFMTIPSELDEAAKIDGCSTFGIFWRIMLPLCVPAMITVGIFAVVYNWNDFMNPLIYLNSSEKYTLALGLNQFQTMNSAKTNLMMAASTVVLMPILVLFFVGQKHFIQGIATTGLKG